MPKVKIRLSRNVLFFVIAVALLTSLIFVYVRLVPRPITALNYKGQIVEFRDDLRKAADVPVYPGDNQVYLDTMHTLVKNVTIAFKDAGEKENGYYIVEEFEIITKMTLAYRNLLAGQPGLSEEDMPSFNAMPVEEYANLPGKIQNPIIALVHPKYANETAVRNEGHVTYISGTNYKDFDLATIRFLMVVLGIDPAELGG
jgi:hypothetical protein